MDCPVCKTERLSISERQGIEIDYCPKCRGVWLDRGELDKLIERATQELAAAAQARPAAAPVAAATPQAAVAAPDYGPAGYRGSHHDEHRYRGHHRKSLWRELFD